VRRFHAQEGVDWSGAATILIVALAAPVAGVVIGILSSLGRGIGIGGALWNVATGIAGALIGLYLFAAQKLYIHGLDQDSSSPVIAGIINAALGAVVLLVIVAVACRLFRRA